MTKMEKETKGVKTLLGDPKKAIIKLAIPMIIAMGVQTIYNLTDAIWVSGLGTNALSAVGFFLPFLMIIFAISNGLGIGGNAAISRCIGAKNKKEADNVAVHTIILMLIFIVIFTVPFFIFTNSIFELMGAGEALDDTVIYAKIMFGGIIFVFFTHVATAILRSEGDANRSMQIIVAGGVLNIILDPIFIYTLKLGVAGAAIATVLSMFITSIVIFYWLFLKKNTYLKFNFKEFKFNKLILKDIFKVGIPSSLAQISMSLQLVFMILIIVIIAGTYGVAVYTAGWRVLMIAVLPLVGIMMAVISVSGANYGAKDYKKLEITYNYALKLGLFLEGIIMILIFFLAPKIALLFTWTDESQNISNDLIIFIKITSFVYLSIVFNMFSSAMFQGIGKGTWSLIITLLR